LIAALNDPTSAAIAIAVWDALQSAHVTVGSFGEIATEIASILADTNELQGDDVPGLIAALNDVAATDIVSAGAITTLSGAVVNVDTVDTTTTNTDMRGTDSAALASVCTEARLSELDEATAGKMANQVDVIETDTTANLDAAVSSRATPAQVNTEVLDVVNTDTITLPGQAAPPLAPTHREAIAWLYKVMRNRKTQTATQWSLLADDESTVDAKATVSDDATTAIKQEIVSGP